MIANALDLLRG